MIGTDIALAARYLEAGEVVAMPTETVYGLAGNAFDTAAVARIFAVKNRPFFDPLIVHTHSIAQLESLVTQLPPLAQHLAQQWMPGALTLLLPKRAVIPDLVTNGSPLVALRLPQHPMAQALLRAVRFPLAAPSANPFGYISPTTAQHVAEQLGNHIPYIIDGGSCAVGIESTIVGFAADGRLVVHRLGGITLDQLRHTVGHEPLLATSTHSNPQTAGQLDRHYSPRKPILVGNNLPQLIEQQQHLRLGVLSFEQRHQHPAIAAQCVLSATASMEQAAAHFFAMLRQLDSCPSVQLIVAQLLPPVGLGLAINDRLKRAAAPAV